MAHSSSGSVLFYKLQVTERVYRLWRKASAAALEKGDCLSVADWCRRAAEADYRAIQYPGEVPNPGPYMIWPAWTLHPNQKTMFQLRARMNDLSLSAWVRGAFTRQAMGQLGATEGEQQTFLDSLRVDARM